MGLSGDVMSGVVFMQIRVQRTHTRNLLAKFSVPLANTERKGRTFVDDALSLAGDPATVESRWI